MIALGCDHGGFDLKNAIKAYLEENDIPYRDFGCMTPESIDYPPIAAAVAHSITGGECEKGILCCGTGIGMSIAANKVKGIRASVCTNEFCTEMTRRHNNANILCLGGRVIDEAMAVKLAQIFLTTPFDGGRHLNRVNLIKKIEDGEL